MRTVLMGVSKRTGEAGRSRTIGSRRIVHCSVTEHPTSEWTLQQFRELLAFDHPYRTLLHDRDSIFARAVDEALQGFGVRVVKTPVRAPRRMLTANACLEASAGSAWTTSSHSGRGVSRLSCRSMSSITTAADRTPH